MSNTAFAIEALHASGLESSDAAYKRAMSFMQRCQMDDRFNDSAFAKGVITRWLHLCDQRVQQDNPGGGQSFAGEISESLSGPPGTIATFSLKKDNDGKPSLKRECDCRVAKRHLLHRRKAASGTCNGLTDAFAGASSDGNSSFDVTVRGMTDPTTLKAAVTEAIKDHLAESSKVETRARERSAEKHTCAYGTARLRGFEELPLCRAFARKMSV